VGQHALAQQRQPTAPPPAQRDPVFQAPPAQQQSMRAEIAAATTNAQNALRADIAAVRMTPGMTIQQYLESMDAEAALDEIVSRAQQIGGPRWVDDQTCQVKLEVSGAQVIYRLTAWAIQKKNASPIPAAAMAEQLKDLKQRTFTATGTSVSADRVQGIRPMGAGDAWINVTDAARGQAMKDARQDAVQHVIESIRTIPLEPSSSRTVGDLLQREPVKREVNSWLSTRPVTGVKFKDDLQVELTLSTPPDDLLNTVINSSKLGNGTDVKIDDANYELLRNEFSRRVSATGRAGIGKATPTTAPQPPRRIIDLPEQPPEWVGQSLDAGGSADRAAYSLKTKTNAEAIATDNLRRRIGALPLSRDVIIEDAAKIDPRYAEAVNRAMLRATVYKVDWRADGGISVRIAIDSRDLWYELRMADRQ
jgi:hypothetical protein